jgi:hypothetical protein
MAAALKVHASEDPTADTSFATSDSKSLAIEFPAVVAMSDLIAELSGTVAEDEPSICEGAVVLSPLQPLASITTAARVTKRDERFCIMTPDLFG